MGGKTGHTKGEPVNLILWLWCTDSQFSRALGNGSSQKKAAAKWAHVTQREWLTEELQGYWAPQHWLTCKGIKCTTWGWLVTVPLAVTIKWSLSFPQSNNCISMSLHQCKSKTVSSKSLMCWQSELSKSSPHIKHVSSWSTHSEFFQWKTPSSFHRSYPELREVPELAQTNYKERERLYLCVNYTLKRKHYQ